MLNHLNQQNPRYERKYFLSHTSKQSVEAAIKRHPAFFEEIYYERPVNNIYFDSHSLQNYFDNIKGLDERIKIRIRWYNGLFGVITSPTLEIKAKHGFVGTKASYPLPEFLFEKGFSKNTTQQIFSQSILPKALKLELLSLKPTLVNRYSRKYFQTKDKKFRITIDSNLEFYKTHPHNNSFLEHHRTPETTIVELKYPKQHDPSAPQITKHLPFEISRSSKYVSGIEAFF